MKFKIKAYNLQELGQRTNQEDSLFPALGKSTSDDRLFVLCDGMGGHEKGEVASATVCETLSHVILSAWHPGEVLSDELFLQALSAAYDALDAKDNGEERKMGTTLTFLCLHTSGATVAHIGDSRIYQLRPASKNSPARIVFHTQDHSLVNDLVKIGEITEEEAKHHPQKNVITRAMQPCQEHRAKADIAHLTDILSGDYFYMCSDGMLEEASDENILNIITKPNATDEQKLEMLRNVTEENKDNHTAHLIHIEKVIGANPILASISPRQQEPKGTLVTPDFSAVTPQPKRRNLLPWLLVALLLVVIAAGASYFCLGNKEIKGERVKPESTKIDFAKGRSAEKKNSDAAIENISSQPVPSQSETSLPASAEGQQRELDSKPVKLRKSNEPANSARLTNQEKPQKVVDNKQDAKENERIANEILKSRKGAPKEEKQTSKFNVKK